MPNYLTTQIPKVIDPISYSKPLLPPTGYASWASSTISRPYFPSLDINSYSVSTPNIGTYFNPPHIIFVSYNTISQPIYSLFTLIPGVQTPLKVLPSPTAPTGYAAWASSTISQPYISPTNNNTVVFNTSFLRALPNANKLFRLLLLGMG